MKEFLSKANQKELRQKYEIALSDVWKTRKGEIDTRMVDFCLKEVAAVVPMSNGTLVAVEKPSIDKDFCFGYSTCGQGMSYKECQETHQAATDNLAEYFKNENLSSFDRRYELILKEFNEKYFDDVRIEGQYHSQSENNPIRRMIMVDYCYSNNDTEKITFEDLENYIEAIKFARSEFEKRINSYLKRYGTSKLRTWTYWVDE